MEAMNFEPTGSEVSLQPLIKRRNDDDRSPKITERTYRIGVLEGNWVEDSAKISPMLKDQWASLSETSYRPYQTEALTRPKYEAWEQRIRSQGVGARIMIDHHGTEYHNNWTTTNELSYNILKKQLCGPRLRKFKPSKKEWVPAQDYTKIYGNLTTYGLIDFMRRKWSSENKPTHPWQTNYTNDFPKYKDTSTFRFLKPRASLNEPDLRHLGIDLSAPPQSCQIAFKTPNVRPYNTELNPSSEIFTQ